MTAKEYLNQAYRMNEQIESNLRQIEKLRDMATNITVSLGEKVQGGKYGNTTATIEKIIDLQRKVNEETDRLVDLFAEIKTVINAVPDTDERLLLTLRYIEFMKWEQIMEKMNFSETQVHRVHRIALKNIIIPEIWQ